MAPDSRQSRRSQTAWPARDEHAALFSVLEARVPIAEQPAIRPPRLLRREGNLVHIDNMHNKEHQPIIPFFVVIILLVCAVLAATFATICCWRSRRQRAAKTGESGLQSSHRNSMAAGVSRPQSGTFALGPGGGLRRDFYHRGGSVSGGGGGPRYEIPTLVFQQHEPDTHGYFAPLYLDPQASRMHGHDGHPVSEEDAKKELRRVWSPNVLEGKVEQQTSSASARSVSPMTTDTTDVESKDKQLPQPPPPVEHKDKERDGWI